MLAGLFVVGCIAAVVYAPSLKMGFRFLDDYAYLYWAGSMPLPQYLEYSWDPRVQAFNYRPLRRMLVLAELNLFQSEASYYHLVQVLIHFVNALLVLGIVRRLGQRWRIAFLAAVLFISFPIASEAVLWITDESALATLFSLTSILFWIYYLQEKNWRYYLFTILSLVLAFLTKESSIVTPVVFFVIDRIMIGDRASLFDVVRRYSIIAMIALAYLGVEYVVQRQGLFVTIGGYSLGWHVFPNYAAYLAMLVFPWGQEHPSASDMPLWFMGFGFMGIIALKSRIKSIFLVLLVFLAIGPVVLAPLGPGARYLYMAVIPWVILLAVFFEWISRQWKFNLFRVAAPMFLGGILVLNGLSIANLAADISEVSRQARVPFRDIMRQHATFSPDTRLFFIEPPNGQTIPEIAGMFMLQYKTAISVGATYPDYLMYTGGLLRSEKANLRNHNESFVYYFDSTNKPVEIKVDHEEHTKSSTTLPVSFKAPIELEGYETSSSAIKKGEPLVLFLYWKATGKIMLDYTVFVHVVDSDGNVIAGEDSYPRNGKEKMSQWRADQFTADARIIAIPPNALPGTSYFVETGLYYLPNLERLAIVDHNGLAVADKIVIGPIQIVE